jgi:pimeloyl-ACP methyl ester carboxylesterase
MNHPDLPLLQKGGPQMPYLKVNDTTLYYEERGSGPETIVFFHSLLFDLSMFTRQFEVFASQYRCIAFDFRGHGKSSSPTGSYNIETLTADTLSVIEQLNCAPCHFLGFSTGGFVGLRLAIRQPELLKSLILVDTSADPEPEENLPKYRLLAFVARWAGLRVVANQVMPIMFSAGFLSDPARSALRKEMREVLLMNDRVGVTNAVKGVISREGVYDLIDQLRIPTLIMVGENDVGTTPDKSERMHARIPNSTLVKIPRSGHMTPVEEPEAVNEALAVFLSDL